MPFRPTKTLTRLVASLAVLGMTVTAAPAQAVARVAPAAPAASSDGAPVTPASKGVALTWAPLYMSDNHDYTRAEATSLAERFDVVAAMPVALDDHVAAMKQTNPDLNLIAYTAATLLGKDKTTGVPEAAFAHDSVGRRITYTSFNKWLMEATNPVWMRLASDECIERSSSAGYDGCLVDMMGTGVVTAKNTVSSRPADPVTRVTYTEAQYQQNLIKLMAYYRDQRPSMIHVPNSVGNAYRYWKADVKSSNFTNTVSAAQMEDFLRGAKDSVTAFPSAADWQLNVDVIRDFESKNKVGLFTTKLWAGATNAQVAQWQKYSMATFLMGANGKSYFAFTRSRDKAGASQTNLPYTMPKNIGMPRTAMDPGPRGTWIRTFANGMSVVNPTDSTRELDLAAPMRNLQGQVVTRVKLPPHSGEVLVGKPGAGVAAQGSSAPKVRFRKVKMRNAIRVLGRARDSDGVAKVRLAVRSSLRDAWLHPNGTWGSRRYLPTKLKKPGRVRTGWVARLELRPGRYRLVAKAVDVHGKRSSKPFPTLRIRVKRA